MTHYSQVDAQAFYMIKSGHRQIEPRLNDGAHRQIRPGDLIVFTHRDINDQVIAKVVGVLRYPSFVELLQAYPAARFGQDDQRQTLARLRQYYTEDQEMQHGVLGIKLHLLKVAQG